MTLDGLGLDSLPQITMGLRPPCLGIHRGSDGRVAVVGSVRCVGSLPSSTHGKPQVHNPQPVLTIWVSCLNWILRGYFLGEDTVLNHLPSQFGFFFILVSLSVWFLWLSEEYKDGLSQTLSPFLTPGCCPVHPFLPALALPGPL